MHTAVVFDLGGVYFTSGIETVLNRIAVKYGLSKEKVRREYLTRLRRKYPTTEAEVRSVWRVFAKDFDFKETPEELERIENGGYVPLAETIAILRKLRSGGVRVYYLSDNTIDRVRRLNEKYNFLDDFEGGVFSYNILSCKPDVRMYQALLKKFNLKATEVVFIDDRLENLAPARKLGMAVIHFKNPLQLRRDLRKLGFAL
jgi:HAD superfamily hydrolase (TIGR01509 family)